MATLRRLRRQQNREELRFHGFDVVEHAQSYQRLDAMLQIALNRLIKPGEDVAKVWKSLADERDRLSRRARVDEFQNVGHSVPWGWADSIDVSVSDNDNDPSSGDKR